MSLTVLDPGMLATVQDLGRVGWAHVGVPRAGALDGPAAALANRLVGNDPAAAVLETTLTGLTLRADENHWVAVTGALCPVRLRGHVATHAEAIWLGAGETLAVGPATSGVRSYVAVAGGIDVAPVLGSRSTDTLAWVGPPALAAGMTLPVGPDRRAPRPLDTPRPPATGALRVLPGPRRDWFGPDALAELCAAAYTVGEASNRIGLRLRGTALARVRDDELASEGIVLGAVQVPPDGQPVVFLADHPVTGGYPVLAVVHPDDLGRCAQLRPGDEVRFRPAPA